MLFMRDGAHTVIFKMCVIKLIFCVIHLTLIGFNIGITIHFC